VRHSQIINQKRNKGFLENHGVQKLDKDPIM